MSTIHPVIFRNVQIDEDSDSDDGIDVPRQVIHSGSIPLWVGEGNTFRAPKRDSYTHSVYWGDS